MMLRSFTFITLLMAGFISQAAVVVYLDEQGSPVGVNRPELHEAKSVLDALANPPSASVIGGQTLVSALPSGSKVLGLQTNSGTTIVEFSPEIIGTGLDEARLETIFEQVSA